MCRTCKTIVMKRLLFIFLVGIMPLRLFAQEERPATHDAKVFRECFKEVRPFTSIEHFQYVYQMLGMKPRSYCLGAGVSGSFQEAVSGRGNAPVFDNVDDGAEWSLHVFRGVTTSTVFVRSAMWEAYEMAQSRKANWPEEKRVLVDVLRRFDSLAVKKPLFYGTIYEQYGGDYEAYVKDLYETSLVMNRRRLRKFMHRPRVECLQSDLGFQFAVGFWLYEMSLGRDELQREAAGLDSAGRQVSNQ